MKLPASTLTKNQKMKRLKTIDYHGEPADIIVTIRHDNECGNGHNTFSITGSIYKKGCRTDSAFLTGGCIHDEIQKHFPDLSEAINYHLTSTDGPMHYVANALYHASDKDCWGHRKGEPCRFKKQLYFEGFPIRIKADEEFINWLETLEHLDLEVMPVRHKPDSSYDWKPKYTLIGYEMDTWHKAPFDTERDALEFLAALQTHKMIVKNVATDIGKGKEPDLAAARNCAIWPDAELSDFTKEKLENRLPRLMENFHAIVTGLGLEY